MKIKILLTLIFSFQTFLFAQLGGEEILNLVDKNMVIDQAVTTATMIVHSRSGTRTIQSQAWVKGRNQSFVEYLSPAREKGKKMLRLDDKLWNYIPEPSDRIITISGHLLKQSVMGSDLSYEDVTSNRPLLEMYTATVAGEDTVNGNNCYRLELKAKVDDAAYHSRVVWIDKLRWLPLKEERYAKSGKLLKRTEILEFHKIGARYYPKKMTFKDMLSRGGGTEYLIDSINFDVEIPDYKFTKAALRK